MKHNLGNFPHHQKTNKPKSKNAGKRTCYAVYEDWFEGFEREIRNWKETIEMNNSKDVRAIILKAILGEDLR